MLAQLTVQDFAVVEYADVEFGPGMTCLTGETGAGKSLLIDALSLALGSRSDNTLIRQGKNRADVTAVFDTSTLQKANCWLVEQSLSDTNADCILRRTISRDGRSKAYINSRPVPVSSLQTLGALLVDIHGQNSHQSLSHASVHRELLDHFSNSGKNNDELKDAFQAWNTASRQLEDLTGGASDNHSKLSLLRYQHDELQRLNLTDGELSTLDQELKRLSSAEELLKQESSLLDNLDGTDGPAVLKNAEQAQRMIGTLSRTDSRLSSIATLLETAVIHLREAVTELRSHANALEPNPERLEWVNSRLSLISDIARKHKVSPDMLNITLAHITKSISELKNNQDNMDNLQTLVAQHLAAYSECAERLRKVRTRAAPKFASTINVHLKQLGMSGANLNVRVSNSHPSMPTIHGNDRVEFLVSNNSQTALPLNKIASGGELSRISLALQLVTIDRTGIPTAIFDEVDAGIGGKVALTVGEKIHQLGGSRQVLCVTHLAQVAAHADAHLRVEKASSTPRSTIQVDKLSGDQRVKEIARMLSGNITAQSIAHAQELLGTTSTLQESPTESLRNDEI